MIEVSFADAKTMNPMLLTDTASGARTAVTFNALVDTSPDDGLPYPELAAEVPTRENGGISADGLTYTFKLRNDVKWHDGTPFTAKDVVYTYETMKKPELGSVRTSELNERVESVSAPNDTTVVFKMKKVVAPFLTDNMYGIVPQHILGSVPVADIKSHPSAPATRRRRSAPGRSSSGSGSRTTTPPSSRTRPTSAASRRSTSTSSRSSRTPTSSRRSSAPGRPTTAASRRRCSRR